MEGGYEADDEADVDAEDGGNPRDTDEVEHDVGVGGAAGVCGGAEGGEVGGESGADVFAEYECGCGREVDDSGGGESDRDTECGGG